MKEKAWLKPLVLILLNAAILVVLVIVGVWLFTTVQDRPATTPTPTLTPTPESTSTIISGTVLLERIQRVNKQIFVEHYNAVDVHYSEAPEGWIQVLGLRQEFVVLIRGHVPAGFDLQQLSKESIWISQDGTRAQLTLPPPIIFEDQVRVDSENSYVLSRRDTCPSFLCRDDLEVYLNEALPQGETYLIDYALENGILDQAAHDGQAYYEQFLKALGFKEVRVVVTGYE